MANWYVSLDELKASLALTAGDTADDALLAAAIEAVSRDIEQWCGRWFYPATQTRYYTAGAPGRLLVDDLLAVTSLKTDEDGDGTFETTWAASDYLLLPFNSRQESPPRSYWEIAVAPSGRYGFPGVARGVELAGTFGYYDVRVTAAATVSGALTADATSLSVSDGAAFKVGQTLLIGAEQLFVAAIAGDTLTVERAQNGTTAAEHADGAAIEVYQYPIVSAACRHQAAMDFRAKDAPLGEQGADEFGQRIRMWARGGLHPFVRRMLEPFRRHVAG